MPVSAKVHVGSTVLDVGSAVLEPVCLVRHLEKVCPLDAFVALDEDVLAAATDELMTLNESL